MDGSMIGLILAGGRSRRMGGRDKALLTLGGETLAARAIARLAPQCDRVLLNAAPPAPEGAANPPGPARGAVAAALDVACVADTVPGHAGPLAGILTGLDWIADHAPGADLLTVPVDGPFFPRDLGARLRAAAAAGSVPAACAASRGRRHGVYGLWSSSLRAGLRQAVMTDGVRRVEDWLARIPSLTVEWPTAPVDPFLNINTPEDLAAAERFAADHPDRAS